MSYWHIISSMSNLEKMTLLTFVCGYCAIVCLVFRGRAARILNYINIRYTTNENTHAVTVVKRNK